MNWDDYIDFITISIGFLPDYVMFIFKLYFGSFSVTVNDVFLSDRYVNTEISHKISKNNRISIIHPFIACSFFRKILAYDIELVRRGHRKCAPNIYISVEQTLIWICLRSLNWYKFQYSKFCERIAIEPKNKNSYTASKQTKSEWSANEKMQSETFLDLRRKKWKKIKHFVWMITTRDLAFTYNQNQQPKSKSISKCN